MFGAAHVCYKVKDIGDLSNVAEYPAVDQVKIEGKSYQVKRYGATTVIIGVNGETADEFKRQCLLVNIMKVSPDYRNIYGGILPKISKAPNIRITKMDRHISNIEF